MHVNSYCWAICEFAVMSHMWSQKHDIAVTSLWCFYYDLTFVTCLWYHCDIVVISLLDWVGLHSLALPVLAHSGIWLWLVSISDEGSLPEIALSGASKLALTYLILFYRSVHVLYTEINKAVVTSWGLEGGQDLFVYIKCQNPLQSVIVTLQKYKFVYQYTCDFQYLLSLWLYTDVYVVIFNTIFWRVVKILGVGQFPPAPSPCSHGHDKQGSSWMRYVLLIG